MGARRDFAALAWSVVLSAVCHPERSEGSSQSAPAGRSFALRAQDDIGDLHDNTGRRVREP
jgi:hypothetical protein